MIASAFNKDAMFCVPQFSQQQHSQSRFRASAMLQASDLVCDKYGGTVHLCTVSEQLKNESGVVII